MKTESPSACEPFTRNDRSCVRIRLSDAQPPDAAFTVAQPIAGRYRVDDLFGAGTWGVLLRATDLHTRKSVLVKALRSERLDVPPEVPGSDKAAFRAEELRRLRHGLQTERRLLVRLRNAGHNGVPHPNDYVYDENPALEELGLAPEFVAAEPYLVLQHLPGVTLEAILATEAARGLPERRALELIRPLVSILATLHEPWRHESGRTWHCIYQDFKPANILIDPLGRPTLLDFGGCQVVVDGVPVLEGGFTHGYSPPECENPQRVLLPCADVYGIGTTLYHMLSGIDPRARLLRWRGEPGGHLDLRALPPSVSGGDAFAARPPPRRPPLGTTGRRPTGRRGDRPSARTMILVPPS